MSKNKQLTTGQPVARTFASNYLAKEVLSPERYEEGVALLKADEDFELTKQESWNLVKLNEDPIFIGVLAGLSIPIISLGGYSLFASLPPNFFVIFVSITVLCMIAGGFSPRFIYRARFKTKPLPHVSNQLDKIADVLSHLENLEVWKNVDEFPMVERFDTSKVLENAKEMMTDVDYRVYNFGVKPKECENYANLEKLLENLKGMLTETQKVQRQFDKMSADEARARKELFQERARRKAELTLGTPVVDVSTELVRDTRRNNMSVLYGNEKALELGRS